MANPYISEVKYLGAAKNDFIEIVVDAGTDVSNMTVTVYNADGSVRSTNALGAVVNTIAGKDVYVIDKATSATFNGLHRFGGVALDNAGTVYEFVSFNDNPASITAIAGAANGMTSTEIGQAGAGHSLETNDSGASYFDQITPNAGTIPACFVDGTLILTPEGEVPVENLNIGDIVITLDRGPQPIRWVGRKAMQDSPESAPIRIAANAFGPGNPARELLVSPYHRVLISEDMCEVFFGNKDVLAPAVFLQNGHSVRQVSMKRPYAYHHLLFDQHEIVFSNGMASESFHPGQGGLDAFSREAKQEVLTLFPELANRDSEFGVVARPVVCQQEASLLMNYCLAS